MPIGQKKERELTDAEQKRLERFDATCQDLVSQGYERVDLQINIMTANIIAGVALVAMFFIFPPLFTDMHPEANLTLSVWGFVAYLVAFVVLIVAHEFVHGLTWSRFTPNGFKDIDFGIMRDSFTPYCTCSKPLPKGPYMTGALMPLVVFGIIPLIAAFPTGLVPLLYMGIVMTVTAAGDVMIVAKVLAHKSPSGDMLLYDHPTEAGSVIFER